MCSRAARDQTALTTVAALAAATTSRAIDTRGRAVGPGQALTTLATIATNTGGAV